MTKSRTPITYHQLERLRKLQVYGAAPQGCRSEFVCRSRGWTEWCDFNDLTNMGERLTAAGRRVLREYHGVSLQDLKGKRP